VSLVEQTGSMTYVVTETEPMLTVAANMSRSIIDLRVIDLHIAAEHLYLFEKVSGLALTDMDKRL
jgi:multiple sugar transport system ATP-binding protein